MFLLTDTTFITIAYSTSGMVKILVEASLLEASCKIIVHNDNEN
jgi:hypothetical protein